MEKLKDCVINPRNFLFLIPTITAIALGVLFLPNFGLGLAAGAVMLVVTAITMSSLTSLGVIEDTEETSSQYSRLLQNDLLSGAVFAPLAEEAVFRGGIQPMLTKVFQMIVPASAGALIGTPLSIASSISIVATGILFGAVHYLNPHKGAFQQAVMASVNGVALGILASQFGIGSALAAHMAFNTVPSAFSAFKPSAMDTKEELRAQNKFRYSPLPA